MVHRKDKKNCPKGVKRCEACKIAFSETKDPLIIKTTGNRDWTSEKTGKPTSKPGNVYLHYLEKCLKAYDGAFEYQKIVLLKSTSNLLSENARAGVLAFGVKLEK